MAARAWAKGALSDGDHPAAILPHEEDAMSDARAFGMDVSVLAEHLALAQSVVLDGWDGIFECNRAALSAFIAACNQWRTFSAGFIGLDYSAADIAWRRMDLELSGDDFVAFQQIEAEAVRLLNGGAA